VLCQKLLGGGVERHPVLRYGEAVAFIGKQEVRSCISAQAAAALANAQQLSPDLGHGRLDVYRAVQAWLEQ
jgi:hypothetical protein